MTAAVEQVMRHAILLRNCRRMVRQLRQQHASANIQACPFAATESLHEMSPDSLPSLDHLNTQCHTQDQGQAEATSSAKPFNTIPGPRGLPVVGNVLKYSKFGPYSFEKILDCRLAYKEKYGPIYKEKLGPNWIVHLFDPADIAAMFREEGRLPSRGKIASLEATYLRRKKKTVGFAFLDGEEWARQRSIIQQPLMFHNAAARYMQTQFPVALDFSSYLEAKTQPNGIIPSLYEDLFKYTIEAIGVVCFDKRLGMFEDNKDAREFCEAINETFICFRSCLFSFPWHKYFRTPMYKRFERAADTMKGIMAKYVGDIAGRVSTDTSGACPFARSLQQENRSLYEVMQGDKRITTDLLENFIMAVFRTGVDSTGNALAFFLYNLANNPEKQALVRSEIDAVLSGGVAPTPDKLAEMHYLKAALRESFRLNFPVFGGSGRVLPTDTILSGYHVPKGSYLFANLAATSRMEEYFPRPLEYHPERWLRDSRVSLQAKATVRDSGFLSLPFGHGLRGCPGKRFAEQGIYLAMISILQKFELSYEGPPIGMKHMPFTQPDQPLNLKFSPRQPKVQSN